MQKASKQTQRLGFRRGRIRLSRRERSERIRDYIMGNAALLFFQNGYLATSLEDIAKVSGVNKASIYYFKAKSTLLYDICAKAVNLILGVARPIVNSDMPAEKKLQNLVANHTQFQIAQQTCFTSPYLLA